MRNVRIYSDGACSGNPGPGGFGTIVHFLDEEGQLVKELTFSAGFEKTTNNRMEISGVLCGLKHIKEPSEIQIITDSKYVVDAFNKKWIENWQKNGWTTASGKKVKNIDLWTDMLESLKDHTVEFIWVKGHAGHPENERCDRMAVEAISF